MKNIFIFCGPLASGKGGMERVASELANELCHRGYELSVGYRKRKELLPAYHLDERIKLTPWDKTMEPLEEYKTKIKTKCPEVAIIFHASNDAITYAKIFHDIGCATIFHEGAHPDRIINNNWASEREISISKAYWERECIYSLLTNIRFTLPIYENSLSPHLKNKSKGFPNAVKPAKNLVKAEQSYNGRKTIINIGGLKANKNALVLVKAFCEIASDYPEWDLKIFSATPKKSAPYVKNMQDLINKFDLRNRIFFNEAVLDIYSEYEKAHIHAISSLSEGLPTCVLEAMAHGIPSIGFAACPGVNSLIKHEKNGLLISTEPSQKEELKKAMVTLMQNDKLRSKLGETAYQDSLQYDEKVTYDCWEQFINNSFNKYIEMQENPEKIFTNMQQRQALLIRHNQRMAKRIMDSIES